MGYRQQFARLVERPALRQTMDVAGRQRIASSPVRCLLLGSMEALEQRRPQHAASSAAAPGTNDFSGWLPVA